MRILHSIHSTNPKNGGPIEGIKQLASMNTAAGHTVEVVCLDRPDAPWVKNFPLPVHALGPSYLGLYGYCPRLVPWLEKNHRNYDIVIINGLWQYNGLGVWKALRETCTPYCVFTHGMLDPWFKRNYPFKHLKKWLYWPWGEYRILRDALAVMFTTEEERRLARRSFWLYHCDEIVVSYGTKAPTGDPSLQREVFLNQFPELRDKRCFLFFGRVHEKKGCDLLITAFANLLQKTGGSDAEGKSLHLVMAGPADSAYADELRMMIEKFGIAAHVTWTGLLSGDLKWGAFAASDAFVLPSHQENFGIAVAESLAAGIPALISNRVNIWREVRLHNAGLVEGDDLQGTEKLLNDWVAMPLDARAKMRKNAVICFDRCFNLDAFANSFVETLTRLGMPA